MNDHTASAVDTGEDPSTTWSLSRNGFTLTPRLRPFIIEVFAGSGRLTRAFRSLGCDAWGIDWKGGRLARETPAFLTLDLTLESEQKFFDKLITHPLLAFVHFAPPCGTCSRAREIRHADLRDGGPPPLRSEAFPLGLPNLLQDHPHEAPRVAAANVLYAFVAPGSTCSTPRTWLGASRTPPTASSGGCRTSLTLLLALKLLAWNFNIAHTAANVQSGRAAFTVPVVHLTVFELCVLAKAPTTSTPPGAESATSSRRPWRPSTQSFCVRESRTSS